MGDKEVARPSDTSFARLKIPEFFYRQTRCTIEDVLSSSMMHATKSDHLTRLKDRRFFLLFLLLLATLIVYPYAESYRFGYYAFRLFGAAAIIISVRRMFVAAS